MQKLSAVIITHNEEQNIDRCLTSLQNIADEIIIVDSNSTDKTLEIAEPYKAKVFQKEWLGYSEQKNYANSKAENDYIISLDADEALSEELKQSILKLKKKGFTDAYAFNRLNNYCGSWIKHTSWYPDTKMRIWNRHLGKWEGEIHETVKFNTETETKHIKGDLLHYSYYTVNEHIAQANKFSEIAAEAKFQDGKTVGIPKIIFAPFFKFIKEYFIKLGLLDGFNGFIISMIASHETFLKYVKLYHKTKSKNKD
jgi:glycosyltransferase involved in cell wall biosynthesis